MICRLNHSHFEANKAAANQGSQDLDEEEGEEQGPEEEEAEHSDGAAKPTNKVPSSNLGDDINDDLDFDGPNNLDMNCKSSPQRWGPKNIQIEPAHQKNIFPIEPNLVDKQHCWFPSDLLL